VHWAPRPAPKDGGRDGGNANQFTISPEFGNLVRESIQNSVDARRVGTDEPVRVRFRLLVLRSAAKDAYLEAMRWEQMRPHVEACVDQAGDQQVAGRLREALDVVAGDDLRILQISDYGTHGLVGPERGQGNFAALTRDNLYSEKQNASAGGSYGLGKAMQYAASALGCVLFSSVLAEPEPATGRTFGRFFARAELVYHTLVDGSAYWGPMWLGLEPEEEMPESYWAQPDGDPLLGGLHMERAAEDSGTTIAVVGLKDLDRDAESDRDPEAIAEHIVAEVERHFWPGIEAGDLEVDVEVVETSTIGDLPAPRCAWRVDPSAGIHAGPLVRALRAHRSGEAAEELVAGGDVVAGRASLTVPRRTHGVDRHPEFEHQAVVLVRRATAQEEKASADSLRRAALTRGAQMVVKTLDAARSAPGAQAFQAVVLAGLAAGTGDGEEDRWAEEFLRAAEPPSHDDWTYTAKLRYEYSRGAKSRLAEFEKAIRLEIRRLLAVEPERTDDGPRDLAKRFHFTQPKQRRQGPTVLVGDAFVDEHDAWHIEGRIRLHSATGGVRGLPEVAFASESGGNGRVVWNEMAVVSGDAEVLDDAGVLAIGPGVREVAFRGVTDPETHPAPARQSTIRVKFRTMQEQD